MSDLRVEEPVRITVHRIEVEAPGFSPVKTRARLQWL
jgi:hypothetical protein